jgi:hypothetical protein
MHYMPINFDSLGFSTAVTLLHTEGSYDMRRSFTIRHIFWLRDRMFNVLTLHWPLAMRLSNLQR